MAKYIMALDAGTTSNRAILFNHEGKIVSVAQREFTQIYPQPGWVEHDANEIWSTMLGVAVETIAKAGVSAEDVAASPTSVKPQLYGTRKQANLYIMQSFGSAAELQNTATVLRQRD